MGDVGESDSFPDYWFTGTLLDRLAAAANASHGEQTGITFVGDTAKENFLSYRELQRLSEERARQLRTLNIGEGCQVLLPVEDNYEFVLLFWSCLQAGAVPVPVAGTAQQEMNQKLLRIWRVLEQPRILVSRARADKLDPLLDRQHITLIEELDAASPDSRPLATPLPGDLAFLQFSSGSTGDPKGVQLTHANLLANIGSCLRGCFAVPTDITLSWMPLWHDMGLIGVHLRSLAASFQQVLMPTSLFVRRPMLWLELVHRHRATHLFSPNFGFEYLLSAYSAAPPVHWDLSSVRLITNGAEPISEAVCTRFCNAMAVHSMSPHVIQPSYGLAENTLAVSLSKAGAPVRGWRVQRDSLAVGKTVELTESLDNSVVLVDCGIVVDTVQVRIADEKGATLPDLSVGRVLIAGASTTAGYYGNAEATSRVLQDGWLDTGDLGFLNGDHIVITGRVKELIIINGANFHPHDIERVVEAALQMDGGNVVACGCRPLGTASEQLVLFIRFKGPADKFGLIAETAKREVTGRLGLIVNDVVQVRRLPKTTSGKLQRYRLAKEWEESHTVTPPPAVDRGKAGDTTLSTVTTLAMRLTHLAALHPDKALAEQGFDSLKAIEFTRQLGEAFQMSLPASFLFDFSTLRGIAAYFDEQRAPKKGSEPPADYRKERIAIVGMGCRFPGGVHSPESFWKLLANGVDAVGPIPSERQSLMNAADATQPVQYGAFLKDIQAFDYEFFGIAPAEAIHLDPQQRLLLETAWETLENAAIPPDRLKGTRTGVFVGALYSDYLLNQLRDGGFADINAYYGTGNTLSAMAGRLSYTFGWEGPSIGVDTACSTSLVAVHLACNALRNGECEVAVAGGVNLMIAPEPMITLSKGRMMSPTGQCRTFDAAADGYVRGEGCGLVLLKPLRMAEADGDRILGVIRGSAVNHDGRSNGLTAPSRRAQATLIQTALDDAGVVSHQVDFVECHGTGTSLGDPIEVGALIDTFLPGRAPDQPLALGAVKTNIGHLEGAAGICGLIKTALVLQHGAVPANLHLQDLNPHIEAAQKPILFPTKHTTWFRPNTPRLAGVSSFGLLGTNAHVVMQQHEVRPCTSGATVSGTRILALSAKTGAGLRALANAYAHYCSANPQVRLGDLCLTANTGRTHFDERLAVLGDSLPVIADQLRAFAAGASTAIPSSESGKQGVPPRVAFVFTDQGFQYEGMGRQLYDSEPVFRKAFDRCATNYFDVPECLKQTAHAQAALFALAYALCELLESWGITPSIVLGHSLGEYVAACRAGVFSLEDAMRLVTARGALMQALPPNGGMAAVRATENAVAAAIATFPHTLSVAAVNSPNEVVISGELADLQTALDALARTGHGAQRLSVSHAFHSPLLSPVLSEFEKVLASISFQPARIPLISNITGRIAGEHELSTASYWIKHVLAPVRFSDSVLTLAEQGCDVVLEVGPRPVLTNLIRRNAPDAVWRLIDTLQPNKDEPHQMLGVLAALYASGCRIHWQEVERRREGSKISLPTYPFQRRRIWYDSPGHRTPTVVVSAKTRPVPQTQENHPEELQFSLMFFAGMQQIDPAEKYRLVMEAARFADQNGFRSVWIPERHFSSLGGLYPNPAILHAALARETRSVRLMAGSVVAPLHDPVRIAEDWAMVDNLSGGRVGISFASGWSPNDFALAPENYTDRRERLYETAETVRRLWRGESITGTNGVGQQFALSLFPTPIQRELPFWLTAAGDPKSFQKAGAAGAHVLTHLLDQEVDDLAEKIRLYRESRREHGHDPATGIVTLMVHTSVGPDAQAAREAVRRPMCSYLKANRNLLSGLAESRGHKLADNTLTDVGVDELVTFLFDRIADTRGLIGSPESCQHLVRKLAAAGVNEIASLLDFGQTTEQALAGLPWLNELRLRQLTTAEVEETKRAAILPERQSAVLRQDTLYQTKWSPIPKAAAGNERRTKRWMIFGEDGIIGDRIAAQIGLRNSLVIRRGVRFPSFKTNEFWIPDLRLQRLRAVWGLAEIEFPTVDGVIFLWPLGAPEISTLPVSELQSCQDVVTEAARQLIQSLCQLFPGRRIPIYWVTRGAVQTAGDRFVPALTQSPLWGFARSLNTEHPELAGSLVDLDPTRPDDENVGGLVAHLQSNSDEDRVAIRSGRLLVERLVRANPLPILAGGFHCRPAASYLITGGLGGVGLATAQWLAERGATGLLLIGRTAAKAQAQSVIDSLRKAGIHVGTAVADINDETSLRHALRDWKQSGAPPVRGVFHAAGAWRDIALSTMEADDLADVLAPKMAGTWNLERQLGQEPLDLFVSFSSLSALIPAHGQANYAAGNAFLDAHAAWRRAQGRPGLSVNWGPWSGVGFGATEAGLQAHNRLESFGIHRIAPEEAFAALDAFLGAQVGQIAVCGIDWKTLARVDPQLATSPLLTGLTHHLLAATAGRAPGFSPQDAQSSVRQIVAAVLRQPAAEVQAHVPLTHLGLDSLMAMEIKNRILAETAVNISIAQFLTGASVQSLAEWVDAAWRLSRMAEAVSRSSEVVEDEQFTI